MNGLDDLDSDILTSLRRRRRGVYGQPDVVAPPQDEGYTPSPEMLAASAGGAEAIEDASLPAIPRSDGKPLIDPDVYMDLTGKEPQLGIDLPRKGPLVDPDVYMDLTGKEPELAIDLPRKRPVIDPDVYMDLTGGEPELSIDLGQPEMPSITFNDDVSIRPEPATPRDVRASPASKSAASGVAPSPRVIRLPEMTLSTVPPGLRNPPQEMSFEGFDLEQSLRESAMSPNYHFGGRVAALNEELRKSEELRRRKPSAATATAEVPEPSAPPLIQAEPGSKLEKERVAEAERQVTGAASSSPATSTDGDDRPDRDEYMRRAAIQHLFNVTPALFGRQLQKVTAEDDYRADLKAWLERKQQREMESGKLKQAERLKELEMLTRQGEGAAKREADMQKLLIGQQGLMDRLATQLGGKKEAQESGQAFAAGEKEKDRQLRRDLEARAAARAAAARAASEKKLEQKAKDKGETQDFKNTATLRREYNNHPVVKRADVVDEAVLRLTATAGDDTGASDMRILYSYMKLLDPDTGVREGELATGAQAGKKIDEAVVSLYNRLVNGKLLAPAQRSEYRKQAKMLAGVHQSKLSDVQKEYTNIAKSSGLKPEYVVGPGMISAGGEGEKAPAAAPAADDGKVEVIDIASGKLVRLKPSVAEAAINAKKARKP